MDLDELRDDIPALSGSIYLNYGAHGPSPQTVVEACDQAVADHEFSAGTVNPYDRASATFSAARTAIARLINARADEIALTQSTGDSINRIADGFEWDADDVVVITDLEHPAGILPWQQLRTRGVTIRTVPSEDGHVDRDAFASAVEGATLVCFSALTWTHGTMLPVRELVSIARDAETFSLVDAVQVPGHRQMDVRRWGADAVAAAGHKWLLGPWGAGFLYVRDDILERLSPRAIGYRSVQSPDTGDFRLLPTATRFEVGSMSVGPYAGVVKAIEQLEAIGLDRIESRIERLTDRLKRQLPRAHCISPRQFESGLVSVSVSDPAAVQAQLASRDIVIRTLPRDAGVRISVHAVTTAAEIDAVADAVSEFT